ncbi:MAG TPA: DUF1624 domain-containing protein [Thermoanaerobacterales bacterium]|nr:DUF1624 domain-containing protein [Thermoanaerobacterales bacterium]
MNRIVEIDFFRGIAILLMMIFHMVFDLSYFFGMNIEYASGFWYYEGKLSAIMFMVLAGIGSNLSKRTTKRGLKLFALGMLLTAITFLLDRKTYIKFGILHFMGISYLLSPLLKKIDTGISFLVGTAVIIIGDIFYELTVISPHLYPLGLMNKDFVSLDYYPLFPYLGAFIFGIIFYKLVYMRGRRILPVDLKPNPLSEMGRHSLTIYLVHQPIILGFLYLLRLL